MSINCIGSDTSSSVHDGMTLEMTTITATVTPASHLSKKDESMFLVLSRRLAMHQRAEAREL